jgi:hypothetical protein
MQQQWSSVFFFSYLSCRKFWRIFHKKRANLVEIPQENKNTIFQKFPELLFFYKKSENSLKKKHYK